MAASSIIRLDENQLDRIVYAYFYIINIDFVELIISHKFRDKRGGDNAPLSGPSKHQRILSNA
jgi:hypothetical protein